MNDKIKLEDYRLNEYCKSGNNCKSCYLKNTCKDKSNTETEMLRDENKRLRDILNKIYLLITDRNRGLNNEKETEERENT